MQVVTIKYQEHKIDVAIAVEQRVCDVIAVLSAANILPKLTNYVVKCLVNKNVNSPEFTFQELEIRENEIIELVVYNAG